MKKLILLLTLFLSVLNLKAQDTLSETYRTIVSNPIENINKDIIFQTKSFGCSNTSEGTIGLVDCDDVGTTAFNTNSQTANYDMFDPPSIPTTTPAAPCVAPASTGNNSGVWHVYDLETGVDQVTVGYVDLSFSGTVDVEMAFYQGADCANLTNAGCGKIIDKSGSSLLLLELSVSGLNDTELLWVYTYASKDTDIDLTLTGTGTPPANDDCANAISTPDGCNLGATGAAFTPPTAAGQTCTGGDWSSNENTVFYTFTATATSGSINIANMTCNDGTGTGSAQVGVWTTCGAVGTYGANFLGCSVGSGSISLPTLVVDDSYIIAVDGFAGDACTWDFVTTGIALNVELSHFNGYAHERGYNLIEWTTSSEIDNSHFTIERSNDGITWENIAKLDGLGNSIEFNDYNFEDHNRKSGINYYRLSQTDYDGKSMEVELIKIDNSDIVKEVLKITNIMGQDVDTDYKGLRIVTYIDGTTKKVYINSAE